MQKPDSRLEFFSIAAQGDGPQKIGYRTFMLITPSKEMALASSPIATLPQPGNSEASPRRLA
jgi:hypothetical protein